jgi:ppGpp synthetase/RelA/SpoT-type nucleotidyltranferase
LSLSVEQIERGLLPFRAGMRRALDDLLRVLTASERLGPPYPLASRFFGRLKSADSVLEKIRRKGLVVDSAADLPRVIPDILGFRIVVDGLDELQALDSALGGAFDVLSRRETVDEPTELGGRGVEYRLALRHGAVGAGPFFELQARTVLQHEWAARTFHLFHKQPPDVARARRAELLALSQALHDADRAATRLPGRGEGSGARSDAVALPALDRLRRRVHLVVVDPGELFAAHVVKQLTGDDSADHEVIVAEKLALYRGSPRAAIVECVCLDFAGFLYNEPLVVVPPDRFDRVVL